MTTGVVFKRINVIITWCVAPKRINVIITWCVAPARRLVPKVGERSGRARTASYGVTGPAFDDDGPECHCQLPCTADSG